MAFSFQLRVTLPVDLIGPVQLCHALARNSKHRASVGNGANVDLHIPEAAPFYRRTVAQVPLPLQPCCAARTMGCKGDS